MGVECRKMKKGENDMEDSQSDNNNNTDGENMKKISDDDHTEKDSSQDSENSEVIRSNCVVVQQCLLYIAWEDQRLNRIHCICH